MAEQAFQMSAKQSAVTELPAAAVLELCTATTTPQQEFFRAREAKTNGSERGARSVEHGFSGTF
jgi:hypothetical protein